MHAGDQRAAVVAVWSPHAHGWRFGVCGMCGAATPATAVVPTGAKFVGVGETSRQKSVAVEQLPLGPFWIWIIDQKNYLQNGSCFDN